MQAIVVRTIGSFEVDHVRVPVPGRDMVLVQVAVTGLCRTDLKIIEAGHRDLVLPRIPGEEVTGTVVALGPDTDPAWLHRRVYIHPGLWCGQCPPCRQGAENLCVRMHIMGFHRDGGFAEFVAAPVQSLIPIPGELPFEHAVFAEPLSCCLNALELSGLPTGGTLGIWGAGPAGLLLSRAGSAMGAQSFIIDPCENRRAFANGLSAAPETMFDACIVAVGSVDAYSDAIRHLAPRGRMVIFSGLPRASCAQPVDFNQLHYHEQTLVGAYGCSRRHGRQALDWIASGRVAVADLISHRLPLRELGHALDLVRNRQGTKILLYPGMGPQARNQKGPLQCNTTN